jgi:hypothetical protein
MSGKVHFDALEDRSVPATFGVPWTDSRITLSFAPDGTVVSGRTSTLEAGLAQTMSQEEWQREILSAFHKWSEVSGLDIAVVNDSGAAFGTAGRLQNDPRFGDIRIGGNRLSADVLAVASPPDPALAGTLAGDVFVNVDYRFDGSPYDLGTVMLHEAGHTLGLDHSTDPNSPMYQRFNNTVDQLTQGDITRIRSLYGRRQADRFEGRRGNETIATAARIPQTAGYNGSTPLMLWGDLREASDVDHYWFDTIPNRGDDRNVTVRLQSSGLSLLGAKVTVFRLDDNGNPVEVANVTSDAADIIGDVLSVTFDGADDDDGTSRRYFVRVESSDSAPFRTGRYALSVNYDALGTVPEATIDQVARGPYRDLGASDLARLLANPNALVNRDGGTNDVVLAATRLSATANGPGRRRFETVGSLVSGDVDLYRVEAPTANSSRTLTVQVWGIGEGVRPEVEIMNAAGQVIASDILVNDQRTFTIQADGFAPATDSFIRVKNAAGAASGNFFLTVDYGDRRTTVNPYAQGSFSSNTVREDTLHVARAHLFHYVLAAEGSDPSSGVRMRVFNAVGQAIVDITAMAGRTVSAPATLLTPGSYTVRYDRLGSAGTGTSFVLRGDDLIDPMGPTIDDPTLEPTFRDPNNPGGFIYPGGVASTDPFLWLVGLFR